jgi:hypothetical protein
MSYLASSMERSEYKNIDQYNIALADSIARAHPGFQDGCRVLFLIQRHSDGGHTNNSKLRSYISRNADEWIVALAKLLQEKKEYPNLPLRIYQTLNARDIEKGIMHFKHMQLDADYFDDETRQWFYLDIRNRIISALMKEPSRATSYFLWDCDTQDHEQVDLLREQLEQHTKVVHTYPTKSGWHIITNPFNYTVIKLPQDGSIEFKKDAMMLLAY